VTVPAVQAKSNFFGSSSPGLAWFKSRAWECFCLTAFLLLIASQVFIPPLIGLSDNNDFSKVFGPANICKLPVETVNTYFVSGYAAGPKCGWPSGFTSSEILLTNIARWLGRPFTGRYWFDLRASAAVHLLVLALAMVILLEITKEQRPLVRFGLPVLAIVMFTDVAYVAYLNSAYMDNAAWVGLLLLASAGAAAGVHSEEGWPLPVYLAGGLLVVFSKALHAALGIPFGGLAGWYGWRCGNRVQRELWLAVAAVLVAGTVVMPFETPPEYANISLYNVIFSRLAPADRGVLAELGLDAPGYLDRVGTQAFAADSPLPNPDWTREFVSRVSFADIALLYLRHPGIAWREINRELHDSVHVMRPDYMANYRREDGFPPHSVASRLGWWSGFRSAAMTELPYLLPVFYVLALAGCALRRQLAPLALALVLAGACEFAICTLADGVDTHRHLFLFHVITDALLLLVVGGGLGSLGFRRELP
jgi:hypothetical protein